MKLLEEKERQRDVIRAACDGLVTVKQAAERLRYSEGWVKALKRRYRQIGDAAFVHGNTGRVPANTISEDEEQQIIGWKKTDECRDLPLPAFVNFLKTKGINRSGTAVTRMLKAAGLYFPRKKKPKQPKVKPAPSVVNKAGIEGWLVQVEAGIEQLKEGTKALDDLILTLRSLLVLNVPDFDIVKRNIEKIKKAGDRVKSIASGRPDGKMGLATVIKNFKV